MLASSYEEKRNVAVTKDKVEYVLEGPSFRNTFSVDSKIVLLIFLQDQV